MRLFFRSRLFLTILLFAPTSPASARTLLALPDGAVASLPDVTGAGPPPLVVLLHGAGQGPEAMIARFATEAALADAVLLAPKSKRATWDVIALASARALSGLSLNDDVFRYTRSDDGDRVTAAMAALAARVPVDTARQRLIGFSDGATFALAFGTSRAQPFAGVIAIAPGLPVVAARPARGRAVTVLHGTRDRTLPIDVTRNTIVPLLRASGLAVRFVSFDGGHEVPPDALTR